GDARVLLVEAGPRLLAAFPEGLARYAERRLTRMGVEVKLSAPVTHCDADGVTIGQNLRVDAATIVWAAGVKASGAGGWLAAPRDKAGRITVLPDLTVPGSPGIYAVGDVALALDAAGRAAPGTAAAAKQMGRYAARHIIARIAGRAVPAPF